MRITITSTLALLAGGVGNTNAFQSPSFVSPRHHQRNTRLAAVDPQHVNDLHSLLTDSNHPAWTLLADAASGVLDPNSAAADSSLLDALNQDLQSLEKGVEITGEVAKNEGWWKAYLNIFKSALTLIHDTIDEPLRAQGITQTWGISIALFTASVRSLLLPLSVQQSKSAEYMKALKPYTKEITEKFKDNDDLKNRAIGKLYEDAEQNPLSGCFVSLAQLPIFLGLYRGVRLLAQDGKLDEPFLWIPSLEGPVSPPNYRGLEWLTEGWHNIDGLWTPQMGWETTLSFLIMPLILVLGQKLTMSLLTPNMQDDEDNMSAEDKAQQEKFKNVFQFLPLLIGFFSLQVPAGLTIYWFTSNNFTLLQSLGVRAYYSANPPKIDLPEYWDAIDDLDTMTPEEKRKAAEAGLSVGPKFSDMVEEANFHAVVERKPLREGSPAWQRVAAKLASEDVELPTTMESWTGKTKIPGTPVNGETASTDAEPAPQTA